jgi:hypothetical protein
VDAGDGGNDGGTGGGRGGERLAQQAADVAPAPGRDADRRRRDGLERGAQGARVRRDVVQRPAEGLADGVQRRDQVLAPSGRQGGVGAAVLGQGGQAQLPHCHWKYAAEAKR